jgi:type II secretory pathway component PulJ
MTGAPETASIIGVAIGGGLLVAVSLLAVAVRASRLMEQVSQLERESRDRWTEWNRMWRDRCSAMDRRFSLIDQRLERSYRGVIKGDD